MRRLQHLQLRFCGADDQVLHLIGEHCKRLRVLDLSVSPRVTAGALARLAPNCPELVGLIISDVSVSAAMFKALARHCPKLQDLRVPSSAGVTAASVRALLACKSLRYLLLPGRKMGKAGAEDLKEALPELAVEWQDAPPDEE